MIQIADTYSTKEFRQISHIPAGKEATIVSIDTEWDLQGRLMGMGLFVGTKVGILRGGEAMSGPLLLGVGNTRIALGRDVAEKILVDGPAV